MPAPADYRELSSDLSPNGRLSAMWTFEASSDGLHWVLPDGCMDLVASFRVREDDSVETLRLIVTGPAERSELVPLRQGDRFLGLRFRAGWGGACLGVNPRALRNRESDPSASFGSSADAIAVLRLARTAGALQDALANFGADAAARAAPLPAAVIAAIDALHTSGGRLSPPELACLTSTPERTLRRATGDAVGLPLKSLAAVLRFQRTLRLVGSVGAPPLAAIALEGGYSDQAHMTREFRRLGGFTPGRRPPLLLVGLKLDPVAEICKSREAPPGRWGFHGG